jgi:hypothetical protein
MVELRIVTGLVTAAARNIQLAFGENSELCSLASRE